MLNEYTSKPTEVELWFSEPKPRTLEDLIANPLSNWCEQCHEAFGENTRNIHDGHKLHRKDFTPEERIALIKTIPNQRNYELTEEEKLLVRPMRRQPDPLPK